MSVEQPMRGMEYPWRVSVEVDGEAQPAAVETIFTTEAVQNVGGVVMGQSVKREAAA